MSETELPLDQIIGRVIALQQKPVPFTPGEVLFWDDPYISTQMLAAHLSPDIEAASRLPQTIDRTVKWLIEKLALKAGDAVLDLGCGPGLYTSRLARAGLRVTGVDYSRRSIDYASGYAAEHGLTITYRYQNYLELADESQYDAVLLIYGDFCPLSPVQRAALLQNVTRALKPGGRFVLDVSTRECRRKHSNKHGWRALESGFWKAGAHLLLEDGFDYPEQSIWLDQSIVIEADGKMSVYRNWFQDYTPETIADELAVHGFAVEGLFGDLAGAAYTPASEWIGLITHRK